MNIHLQYLNGNCFTYAGGWWGVKAAASIAMEGGQTCLFDPKYGETQIAWVGCE